MKATRTTPPPTAPPTTALKGTAGPRVLLVSDSEGADTGVVGDGIGVDEDGRISVTMEDGDMDMESLEEGNAVSSRALMPSSAALNVSHLNTGLRGSGVDEGRDEEAFTSEGSVSVYTTSLTTNVDGGFELCRMWSMI